MREILFRGKRIDTGEWVEAFSILKLQVLGEWKYLIGAANNAYMTFDKDFNLKEVETLGEPIYYNVDPNTIEQFTGFADKNGVRIFEGDIFQMDEDDIAIVVFKNGCFRLDVYGICGAWTESGFDESGGGLGILDCDPIDWYFISDMEVIGNIHDNPELLGGKDGN